MNRVHWITLGCALLLTSAGLARAEEKGIHWRTDMKQAYRESRATGKPMFVQLTAEWCGYCTKMEKTTFHDPQVIEVVNRQFIPLMVNADDNEKFGHAIGLQGLPTSVIISPQLELLDKLTGYQSSWAITKTCGKYQLQNPDANAIAQNQTKSGDSTSHYSRFERRQSDESHAKSVQVTSNRVVPTDADNPSSIDDESAETGVIPPEEQAFAKSSPSSETTVVASDDAAEDEEVIKDLSDNDQALPPLAFDGYCLVSALDDRRLTEGMPQFGVIYANKIVYFASEAHRNTFIENPKRYWPANDGRCPISEADGVKHRDGQLRFATVYRNQIWLFADDDCRGRFIEDPRKFTNPR